MVAGIFAGVLADRVNRWLLMAACDLARMVLYGLIPLAWALHPQVWLLYVILPLCAAIGMIFQVGYVTVVPALVGPGQITEANGLLYAAQSAAAVAGPLLAGLISSVLGPANAIAVNAASFAVSAVVVVCGIVWPRGGWQAPAPLRPRGRSRWLLRNAIRDGHPGASGVATPDAPVPGSPDPAGAWRELLAGARFLWQHPTLRALTILLTFYIFATQGLPDVLIYYLKHDLGQGDGVVGLVLAVAALGTVAGALLVAPLRRRLTFGTCWTGAVILSAPAIAGLGATGSVPPTAALAALYLGCASVAGIASMSLRQQVTPDHLLGRVTAAFWTIHFSLGPLGAALLTWAAGHYGVMPACVASGVTCFFIGTIGLLTPIRRRASRPGAAAAET